MAIWKYMLCVGAALLTNVATFAAAGSIPSKVEVRQIADDKFELLRDGKPFFIKGVGGSWSRETLAASGANSFRTWHVGDTTPEELDTAQKNGLAVSLGIWLKHKDQGFDYRNAELCKKQLEDARRIVERYKNHPAVLIWSLGNEMENGNDIPELWNQIEALAKMTHEVDPNHPTMTIIAEVGGQKVQNLHKYCPSIDIVGINSYAGGPSVVDRYRKNGGKKPVIITEFGPAGQWESHKNAFGAVEELTSTEKTKWYRNTYEKAVLGSPGMCLGSYAFIWGFKVEATSTWYGMFLPDGSKLAAVDTMQELWTGKPAEHPCPTVTKIALTGPNEVNGGETIKASIDAADASGDKLNLDWQLFGEQRSYGITGPDAKAAPSYKDAIEANGAREVSIKLPNAPGVYRIYCYVRNQHGGAAVASCPVKVNGAKTK